MATPTLTAQEMLDELARWMEEQQELFQEQEDIFARLAANKERIAQLVADLTAGAASGALEIVALAPATATRHATARTPPQLNKHDYGMVVLLEDTNLWTEIWCHLCKGHTNARSHPHEFFDGIDGLTKHYLAKHKDVDPLMNFTKTAAVCGRRALSKEDVGLIRRGEDPKVPILLEWNDDFKHSRLPGHKTQASGPGVPRTALNDEAVVNGEEIMVQEGKVGDGESENDEDDEASGQVESAAPANEQQQTGKRTAAEVQLGDGDDGEGEGEAGDGAGEERGDDEVGDEVKSASPASEEQISQRTEVEAQLDDEDDGEEGTVMEHEAGDGESENDGDDEAGDEMETVPPSREKQARKRTAAAAQLDDEDDGEAGLVEEGVAGDDEDDGQVESAAPATEKHPRKRRVVQAQLSDDDDGEKVKPIHGLNLCEPTFGLNVYTREYGEPESSDEGFVEEIYGADAKIREQRNKTLRGRMATPRV